jgi:hypothetical protein
MAKALYRPEKQISEDEDKEIRNTVLFFGGVCLMVFGAGLVMTNPTVRRYLSRASVGGVGDLVQMALPDLEAYLKLRSM